MSAVDAAALDAADPLAGFRHRFGESEAGRIYLDGNSLGRPSEAVETRVAASVREWGDRLVEGWVDWVELPRRVGDRLAAACLGARPGEVLVTDTTTVNLFKLAHAALDLRDGAVVTDAGNFPTDRYVLEGVAQARGRRFVLAGSVEEAVATRDAALVCLAHVDYRSGRRLDIATLTAGTNAFVIWDLSHSAGAVPVDLSISDLAVGCSYKYLNAGPGAPAFLYVRRELQDAMVSPIRGWFSQRDQFEMGPTYTPAEGIDRFMAGTPPIVGLVALDASLEIIEEAGIDRIGAKAEAITSFAIGRIDERLVGLGFEVASPRAPEHRGAHVALRHELAWPICRALIEDARVVPDFRRPDIVRLGMPPLSTSYAEVAEAIERLRALVKRGDHVRVDAAPRRIT
ncbi:MAG TPA: aminotransferase class V-fold PLP-dependent enzyme [Candidatus Limnocylindrales bacterium]|nr:aminotransferase class V-fold PLP-dependent enzyme [Candidatus Limnocylindrales bacterium]